MSLLRAILPSLNPGAADEPSPSRFTAPKHSAAESFDHLMARKLSSNEPSSTSGKTSTPPKSKPNQAPNPETAADTDRAGNPATPPAITSQKLQPFKTEKTSQNSGTTNDDGDSDAKFQAKTTPKVTGQELPAALIAVLSPPAATASAPSASSDTKINSAAEDLATAPEEKLSGKPAAPHKTANTSTDKLQGSPQTSAEKDSNTKSIKEQITAQTDSSDLLKILKGGPKGEAKPDAKLADPAPSATGNKTPTVPLPLSNPVAAASKAEAKATLPDNSTLPPADHSTLTLAVSDHPAANNNPEAAAPPATEDTSGTTVAKQELPMKKAAQIDKVAGQAEKVLPGNSSIAASKKILPPNAGLKPNGSPAAGMESTVSAAAQSPLADSHAITSTAQAAPASAVKAQAATVEHTHNLVAMNAVRLHESGASSLRVVIKPDNGTQLSLELRQRDNGVEAQATLQSGNFAHLNHHWPELQQRLEQRGVRLSALASEQNFTATGNGQNQFQPPARQSGGEDTIEGHRSVRFATAGATDRSQTTEPARTSTHRGWETWA